MRKIIKVTQVAKGVMVLLLVASVSNTRASSVTEAPCSPADLDAILRSLTSWISSLASQGSEPAAVAASIFNFCDTNDDSALNQTELVNCVESEQGASIGDACISLLLDHVYGNSDGVVDLAELTTLVTSVGGQGRYQRRRNNVQAGRGDGSRIRSGLKGGVLKEDRSDSGSHSREDVLREDRDDSANNSDSESSGDESDSHSREDVLREDRDDSDNNSDSESSGDDSDSHSREDVLREDRDVSANSSDSESSGDDSDSDSREGVLREDRDDSANSSDSESSGDDSDSDSREDVLREDRDDSSNSSESESSGNDSDFDSMEDVL